MIIDLNNPFYSYETLISDANKLAEQYSNILQCVTIGKSHDNRDIILLKLGLGQKYMTVCAGVHARETINPIVMLRIVEFYADIYANHKEQKMNFLKKLNNRNQNLGSEYEQMIFSDCIYELLQTFTILFVPLLNPDGYMISLKGFDSIHNEKLRQKCMAMELTSSEWKYNARGVDINRNFPSRLWKQKNERDYAASENETKTLIYLFHEYKSKGFLDFHSRGKEIYYYRSTMSDQYNKKQEEIAKRLKKITNYTLVAPEDEVESGDSGGNTVHYFSEHFRKPALTIETVEDEAQFPLDITYRFSTFDELKLVIFKFASMII